MSDNDDSDNSVITFPLIEMSGEELRYITPKDLLSLGMSMVAYVRPVNENDEQAFQICAADGTILATLDDYSHAMSTISINDLEAVPLH